MGKKLGLYVVFAAMLCTLLMCYTSGVAYAQEQRVQQRAAVPKPAPTKSVPKKITPPAKKKVTPTKKVQPAGEDDENNADEEENYDEEEEYDEEGDTSRPSIIRPIEDRRTPFWEHNETNSFNRFKEGSFLNSTVNYDPITGTMRVEEKIGDLDYRRPMRYTKSEFQQIQARKNQDAYFKKRANMMFFMNRSGALPRFSASDYLFNNVFGINDKANTVLNKTGSLLQRGKKIIDVRSSIPTLQMEDSITKALRSLDTAKDASAENKAKLQRALKKVRDSLRQNLIKRLFNINPQGFIDFTAGWESFKNNIPSIPENLRQTSAPLLDMQYDLNLNAQVGNKLKLPLNLSNQNNFNLSNPISGITGGGFRQRNLNNVFNRPNSPFQLAQLIKNIKINYEGTDDQIIKQIELGGTSFESGTQLIPSVHNLFGAKTKLQFGKLSLTSVFALQLSKIRTITLNNGAIVNNVRIRSSEYDENRNFLLGHYFRKNFNTAMSQLPVINSRAQILRVEVWVTNRNRSVNDSREIIGLADLGECGADAINPALTCATSNPFPANETNPLYANLSRNAGARNTQGAQQALTSMGMVQGRDYEHFYAYKLPENAYTFNPYAGFLMIYESISPEYAVSVSYEYMLDGQRHQVGEFSNQLAQAQAGRNPQIIFTKLLKPIIPTPRNPIWKLMMKNVYSLGASGVQREGFDIKVYYQDPGSAENVFMPFALPQFRKNIVELIRSDRLNNNNDGQPDGMFDYVEGSTIFSERGKMVFPVLEPFGRDLEYTVSPADRQRHIFYPLYDSIKIYAQLQVQFDRFFIGGGIKNNNSDQVFLGVANIEPGSVQVFQGALPLRESIDYIIDYNIGSLTIVNRALLDAKIPITIRLEDNTTGGLQQKTFLGVKTDYQFTPNLHLGASFTRYNENPFNLKTPVGQDPVNNILYGMHAGYKFKFPSLSWALDKLLPFYVTETMSDVNVKGELASMVPGTSRLVGKGSEATVYIDDFETSNANIPLEISPPSTWSFASTPLGAKDGTGTILFPEASLSNNLSYGYNRAKLAWYQIEPNLQNPNLNTNPARAIDLTDHRWRQINTAELFPSASVDLGQGFIRTFDIAYYPSTRGPYNFSTTNVDATGRFTDPAKRWAGIMTSFKDQSNFETRNVQFIEFWVQDPFVFNTNPNGGQVYFNLGNLSEDVLKDHIRMYENGLPTPSAPSDVVRSVWGKAPANLSIVSNAFTNNESERILQDIGLDGLDDVEERTQFANYLNTLQGTVGGNSAAFTSAFADPAGDNFMSYRDPSFSEQATILERYANFNAPQGNSTAPTTGTFVTTAKLRPDGEDINEDNIMNESEDYFEYRLDFKPNMNIGDMNGFIVDRRRVQTNNTRQPIVNWYLVRVPLTAYTNRVGNIVDFKSIRFMRMFFTGFEEDVVFRLTHFSLVAPSWRTFEYDLNDRAVYQPRLNPTTPFLVSTVSIEQNDTRFPIPYALPPGIERIQQTTLTNAQIFLNEQSLSLRARGLMHNDSRAVFKVFDRDVVQYGKMEMFIHAEGTASGAGNVQRGDLSAVIRLGNDMVSNYYEITIPLEPTTPKGFYTREEIWPEANNLNLDLTLLPKLKLEREQSAGQNVLTQFTRVIDGRTYKVVGNPSLGRMSTILVALKNTHRQNVPVDAEIWINELRLSDLNQQVSYAGNATVDFKLADLGTMSLVGAFRTAGFGGIEQKVSERPRDNFRNFGIVTNLELGKITPDALNITIPFYMNYSLTRSTPEYDPFQLDVKLKDRLTIMRNQAARDSLRRIASETTTSQVYSISNMRLLPDSTKRLHFWSPSLWALSYTYSKVLTTSPKLEQYEYENQYGSIVYAYDPGMNYKYPLRRLIRKKSLEFIKQLNYNLWLTGVTFQTNVQRSFTANRPRNINDPDFKVPEYYTKFFVMERVYAFRWNLTRSLQLSYNAQNFSRIDEPDGRVTNRKDINGVLGRLFSGGRNVQFNQTIGVSYDLPTNLIKALEWTKFRLTYNVDYRWVGASNTAFSVGNTIYNNQQRGASMELNFGRLFGRIPSLRDKKDKLSWQSIFVTWIDNIRLSYTERLSTTLPGFMPVSRILGNNWRSMEPGLGFIFGKQLKPSDMDALANKGMLTSDPRFNNVFLQTYEQDFRLNVELNPFLYFNVQLNMDYRLGKNYTELFKNLDGTGYKHLNPYSSGRFEMSYWAFPSMFDSYNSTTLTRSFQQFMRNRAQVSERIGKLNPNSSLNAATGFYGGYNNFSQDVLITSFVAAYSGRDLNKIPLLNNDREVRANPFAGMLPLPDWRISFSGLSHIPGIKKIFSQILLSNGYTGLFSVNALASNPSYEELSSLVGVPIFVDSLSGNFVPYYRIPNITISDRFDPLFGIDVVTKNSLTLGFKYGRERTVSLSMVDFQISENYKESFSVNFSHRFKGPQIFKRFFKTKTGKNIVVRFDMNYARDYNYNIRLDQFFKTVTGGNRIFTILPAIEYNLTNNLILRFFYEYRDNQTNLNLLRNTNQRGGVTFRMSFGN